MRMLEKAMAKQAVNGKVDEKNTILSAGLKLSFLKEIKIPLLYILKDIKDTFKPYKTKERVARDLIKPPFYGIRNIFKGIGGLILLGLGLALSALLLSLAIIIAALLFIPVTIVLMMSEGARKFVAGFAKALFFDTIRLTLVLLVFVTGLAMSFFRGITQIAAWPLTILRAPIRGLITAFSEEPMIEDSTGLREMVKEYDEASRLQQVNLQAIYEKINKATLPLVRLGLKKEVILQLFTSLDVTKRFAFYSQLAKAGHTLTAKEINDIESAITSKAVVDHQSITQSTSLIYRLLSKKYYKMVDEGQTTEIVFQPETVTRTESLFGNKLRKAAEEKSLPLGEKQPSVIKAFQERFIERDTQLEQRQSNGRRPGGR